MSSVSYDMSYLFCDNEHFITNPLAPLCYTVSMNDEQLIGSDDEVSVTVDNVSQNVSRPITLTGMGRGKAGTLTPFDSTRARAARLAQLEDGREELRQAALQGGTLAAAQIPDLPSADRIGLMASIFSNHALNAHDPSARGSVASARLVIENAYPRAQEFERERLTEPVSVLAQAMGVELARLLLARVRGGDGDAGDAAE